MVIKALKAFTIVSDNDGVKDFLSVAHGVTVELDDDLAYQLIDEGLAEEYNLIEPKGTVEITSNGNGQYVGEYLFADVNVIPSFGRNATVINNTSSTIICRGVIYNARGICVDTLGTIGANSSGNVKMPVGTSTSKVLSPIISIANANSVTTKLNISVTNGEVLELSNGGYLVVCTAENATITVESA